MTDTLTIQAATHPEREVVLTSGQTVRVRQLLLRDWQEMLGYYGRFLEVLALYRDGALTDADVETELATVLAELFTEGVRDDVATFLRFFCDLDATALDVLTRADFDALWEAIYADNRRPFALRRAQLEKLGVLDAMRAMDAESLICWLSSMEPASTPATPPSPSPTPSASPKPARRTRATAPTIKPT